MVANNQSIIYDVEANTETILPDIPNNVRVTNPIDGSAILLPLSPPDFIPEVLVCRGTAVDPAIQPANLSSQFPATSQCSHIELTLEGIVKGWEVEHMLEGSTMSKRVHLPDRQVLTEKPLRAQHRHSRSSCTGTQRHLILHQSRGGGRERARPWAAPLEAAHSEEGSRLRAAQPEEAAALAPQPQPQRSPPQTPRPPRHRHWQHLPAAHLDGVVCQRRCGCG